MSFNKSYLRSALLCGSSLAVLTASMAYVTQAVAQDEIEQVVVTGSRIVRKDLAASSPVTVIGAEEITTTGTTRIEDLVASLPQAFTAQNSTVANGSNGTATVALRKLGSSRTLVLINGRRTAGGDPYSQTPDLNFIPTQLIKRVEVLTGGASSVYGADAVAGVVNFILDTDFEGLKMDAQYSFYQHNNDNAYMQGINRDAGFDVPTGNVIDGITKTISLAGGSNFADGRGHASVYMTYRDIGSITKSSRDFTACELGRGVDGPRCSGSSTSAEGRFIVGSGLDYVLDWNGPGNTFKPREGEVFNYGPYNHIQRPDTKWSAGGFFNYQVTDDVESYFEVMMMDDNTRAQIAPSGNFGRTSTINCDNPMLSAQQYELICSSRGYDETELAAPLTILRRNVEGGNRTSIIRHTSYRFVAGLRGQIDDTWNFDIYGLHSTTVGSDTFVNGIHAARIATALDVITDPTTGEMVCRNDRANGCVPWNIFEKGGVTQEAVDYMSATSVTTGSATTQIVSGSVVGNLGDYGVVMPGAMEGVQLALGAEHRKEGLVTNPDFLAQNGFLAGSGGKSNAYDVSFNVSEIFGEAVIPLIQGRTLVEDLTLELAARYSEYNLSGGAITYKAGVTWTPVNSLKFRGGYNRAIRAPRLLDLYAYQNTGLGGSVDICANDPTSGLPQASAAECALTGVSAAQYGNIIPNPADQYNTLTGGNPNLRPEIADTLTLGIVYTPDYIPGFTATLDYFNINIVDTIGSLGADDIIQTCATTGNPDLCSLINRDSQGTLWLSNAGYTETTSQNIGELNAEGIDVNMNYSFPVGDFGDIRLAVIGTYILSDNFKNPLTDYDCVGYFGNQCGQPNPKWRHKARVTWASTFGTNVSVSWRFIGATVNDDFSPDPDIGSSSASNLQAWITNGAAQIPKSSFFDISISHAVSDSLRATIGVNNFMDSEPPLLPNTTSTGFGGAYDTLGRYMFASISADF